MFEIGGTIATTTTTRQTMATKMIAFDLMFLLKIGNLVLRMMVVTCDVLRI